MNRTLTKNLLTGIFISLSQLSFAEVVFNDDFESGKASSFWTDLTYVAITPLPSETGRTGSAMRFSFIGDADDTKDAFAEARFDLKAEYTDLSIKFDLFIPANYVHTKPSDRVDNNKFFRLWREKYGVGDHIGASMLAEPDGDSFLGVDYKLEPTWGISTAVESTPNFITLADRGKWIAIRIEVEAWKSATDPGDIRIYKDNVLFVSAHSRVPDVEPGVGGWRYGYLLGWANSGFREKTILYIDNVLIENVDFNPPIPSKNNLVR